MSEEVTEQDILNVVWQTFIVEGAPRGTNAGPETVNQCAYINHMTGTRCAVGVLLSLEEADIMEAHGGSVSRGRTPLPARFVPHMKFLSSLQEIHDHSWRGPGDTPENRQRTLRVLAAEHGLVVPA